MTWPNKYDSADIYDDLISRRVNTSDAEKFAELCPCCCAGPFWGVLWLVIVLKRSRFFSSFCGYTLFTYREQFYRGMISFAFLFGAMYLGLALLS